MRFSSLSLSFAFLASMLALQPVKAAAADHWIGTWASAQVPSANKDNAFATDTTLRQIVHVSHGGTNVRVVFTNEFGGEPLTIGGAQVAPAGTADAIKPQQARPLTFAGQPGAVIPPGAVLYSDPVELKLLPLSNLTISLFLPAQALRMITTHSVGLQTDYLASGNQMAAAKLTAPHEVYSWQFLKSVEVQAADTDVAIVTLGDSITDGSQSPRDANMRWPDELARRLQADKRTVGTSVLNLGISGNRILSNGANALARFDRDVLAQDGVGYLIVLEGINDIGSLMTAPGAVTADQLIAGLEQIIVRAHAHGIKVYGATLTPYEGAKYATPEGEKIREAENEFILHGGKFDGVIDFARATAIDPAHPTAFSPAVNSGDHLHPKGEGYKIKGDSIDLKLFAK